MPSPEIDWELLSIDYTELERLTVNLPKNLDNEFHRVLLSGDVGAIEKYYRDVILPYRYSAGLEKGDFKEWEREKSAAGGKKSGLERSIIAQENYSEWQLQADKKWGRNPDLSKSQVAKSIASLQKEQSEYDSEVVTYSAETIRRKIIKK